MWRVKNYPDSVDKALRCVDDISVRHSLVRPVAARCCQLHCLRDIHERTWKDRKRTEAPSTRVRIVLKALFFLYESAVQLHESRESGRQNPIFFKPFFPLFFYWWIRRICEFRRVDDWNGIFSNSVMCAVWFHPDSFHDGAWVLCSRTLNQGTRYVEAPRVLTVQAKTCLSCLYY